MTATSLIVTLIVTSLIAGSYAYCDEITLLNPFKNYMIYAPDGARIEFTASRGTTTEHILDVGATSTTANPCPDCSTSIVADNNAGAHALNVSLFVHMNFRNFGHCETTGTITPTVVKFVRRLTTSEGHGVILATIPVPLHFSTTSHVVAVSANVLVPVGSTWYIEYHVVSEDSSACNTEVYITDTTYKATVNVC